MSARGRRARQEVISGIRGIYETVQTLEGAGVFLGGETALLGTNEEHGRNSDLGEGGGHVFVWEKHLFQLLTPRRGIRDIEIKQART